MEQMDKYYKVYANFKKSLEEIDSHRYMTAAQDLADDGKDTHVGKVYSRVVDLDWVEAVESTLIYIDKAIREQRRFIEVNEEIVPIEKARNITTESVRHLAQHTNLIARVEGDDVTPERILNIQREESFAIYENRFLYTLLQKLAYFVGLRYKALSDAPNDSYSKIKLHRSFQVFDEKVEYDLSLGVESHTNTKVDLNADVTTLSGYERVLRIRTVLGDFMSTPLMRELTGCETVRPPILHTNLMTKNPNFKKSLDLWNYIETYTKPGYIASGNEFDGVLEKKYKDAIYDTVTLQQFVMALCSNPELEERLEAEYQENEKAEKDAKKRAEEDRIKLYEQKAELAVLEERDALRLDIDKLNDEIGYLKKNIADLSVDSDNKDRKIERLQADIKHLEKDNSDKDQRIASMQLELDRKEAELEQVKATLEKLNEELAEKDATISALNSSVEQLNKKIAQQNEKIVEFENEVSSLKSNIDELNSIIDDNKAEIEEKAETIKALEEEISLKNSAIEELNKTVSEREEKIVSLENELQSKQAEIEAKNSEIKANGEKILSLETKVSELDTTVSGLNEKVNNQSQNILQKENKIALDAETISNKENEISALKDEIVAQNQTISSNNDTISNKDKTIKECNASIASLNEKIDLQAKTHIAEMEKAKVSADKKCEKEVNEARKEEEIKFKKQVSQINASAKAMISSAQSVAKASVTAKAISVKNERKLENGLSVDEFRALIKSVCSINKVPNCGKVQVLADDYFAVPTELLKSNNIEIVELKNGENDKFEKSIAPLRLLNLVKPYIEQGKEIVYIASDEKHTGVAGVAELVAKEAEYNIKVVNASAVHNSVTAQALGINSLVNSGESADIASESELVCISCLNEKYGIISKGRFKKLRKANEEYLAEQFADIMGECNKNFVMLSSLGYSEEMVENVADKFRTEFGFKDVIINNVPDKSVEKFSSKALSVYYFR